MLSKFKANTGGIFLKNNKSKPIYLYGWDPFLDKHIKKKGISNLFYLYGKKLEKRKKLRFALTSIQGIGNHKASEICTQLGFGENFKVSDLRDTDLTKIQRKMEKDHIVEGNLRKELQLSVQRFQRIGCYKGFRHHSALPVRGQRTHSNGKTQKRIGKRFQK